MFGARRHIPFFTCAPQANCVCFPPWRCCYVNRFALFVFTRLNRWRRYGFSRCSFRLTNRVAAASESTLGGETQFGRA